MKTTTMKRILCVILLLVCTFASVSASAIEAKCPKCSVVKKPTSSGPALSKDNGNGTHTTTIIHFFNCATHGKYAYAERKTTGHTLGETKRIGNNDYTYCTAKGCNYQIWGGHKHKWRAVKADYKRYKNATDKKPQWAADFSCYTLGCSEKQTRYYGDKKPGIIVGHFY